MNAYIRSLQESQKLNALVSYPDEKPLLVGELTAPYLDCEFLNRNFQGKFRTATAVASVLKEQGRILNRALSFAKFWVNECLRVHPCGHYDEYRNLFGQFYLPASWTLASCVKA